MSDLIYLDHNSTTPLDPAVREGMVGALTDLFGNPSNRTHSVGERAARAVERARSQVAAAIGAAAEEVVFTSGATESNNLAILGAVKRATRVGRGPHVVTTAVEHPAVLEPCRALERDGIRVTVLAVDRYGRVEPEAVNAAITPDTTLVSVMAANNEVGTTQPVEEVGQICRDQGVLFHCDAAQALGRLPLNVDALRVDLLSLSAHKAYGPKGVGALYVRGGKASELISAITYGGGQEWGLRPGTPPVPDVVGFGIASALAANVQPADAIRLRSLRERLRTKLASGLGELVVHGHPTDYLPGLLSVSIPGVDAHALLCACPSVAASQGSACSSNNDKPSHVLRAMGVPPPVMAGTIRFGVGRFTTRNEIDRTAGTLADAAALLR